MHSRAPRQRRVRTTRSSMRSAPKCAASSGERSRGRRPSSRPAPAARSAGARRRRAARRRGRKHGRRDQGASCRARWGCCRCTLLRERRSSFVELYSYDNLGKTNYGTAGYLGGGYFVTVKHAVVALKDEDDRQSTRKITSIKIVYKGKEIPAQARRHRRRRRGSAQRRLGDHQDARSRSAGAARRHGVRATTSPSRSSASATTTRRGSSSRPATSASGRRTAWSPA